MVSEIAIIRLVLQPFLEIVLEMDDFMKSLYGNVLQCVKGANSIPNEDSDFSYQMKNPEFKAMVHDTSSVVDAQLRGILKLVQELHSVAVSQLEGVQVDDTAAETFNAFTLLKKNRLHAEYGNGVYVLSELMDQILELVDEYCKQKQVVETKVVERVEYVKDRPQCSFEEKVDNGKEFQHERDGVTSDEHPYAVELKHLRYPERQMEWVSKEEASVLHEKYKVDRKYTYVDSKVELEKMKDVLEKVDEFAVDLEHHSMRSFQGFTCLMQISTRMEDFVIDTILLRKEMQCLRKVFADGSKLKVLHGANMDILWLQRDFQIYVVNMFDTGQAARILEYPGFSLAYLLQLHCKLQVNKAYQLADWRIRPLSAEMQKYARQDTSDLLYVYDLMKRELVEKSQDGKSVDVLLHALKKSNDVALLTYRITPAPTRAWCRMLANKLVTKRRKLSQIELNVAFALFCWRDKVARELDESTGYVLSNAMVLRIASNIPHSLTGLQHSCKFSTPILKSSGREILNIIEKAKEETSSDIADNSMVVEESKRIANLPKPVHKRTFEEVSPSAFIFEPWRAQKVPRIKVSSTLNESPIGKVLSCSPQTSQNGKVKAILQFVRSHKLVKETLQTQDTEPVKVAATPIAQDEPESKDIPDSLNIKYDLPGKHRQKVKAVATPQTATEPFNFKKVELNLNTEPVLKTRQPGYNPFINMTSNAEKSKSNKKGKFSRKNQIRKTAKGKSATS